MHTIIQNSSPDAVNEHVVVVRYFLDRAGYDLQHSSARLWKGAPTTCKVYHIDAFLDEQGIKDAAEDSILVEVYLDKYECYMSLAALDDNVVFDFSNSSAANPGILNIRLTDLKSGAVAEHHKPEASSSSFCSTSPVGLFAFSLTVILETADLYGKLFENSVNPSFVLTWGPYAFFVSGLIQLIVGMFEVTRNNIYGATAFMAFGSFWLANGTRLVLTTYFPDQISPNLDEPDPVGTFIRNIFIFAFLCVLFKQTLVASKLSSLLIALTASLVFATALSGFSVVFQWIQMIFGTSVSLCAFYVFTAELTNEVYQREVFNMYPWSKDSPKQIFAAAGSSVPMQSRAAMLRTARSQTVPATNFRDLRSVQPSPSDDKKTM